MLLEWAQGGEDVGRRPVERALDALEAQVDAAETKKMLGGEHDAANAIVSIHPGAGGTESQDWAEMLLRMYLKWAERRGFKRELLDYQPGEEAGLKSVTLTLTGEYAFGLMSAEAGVHRLVRISPFDQAARRHTSFASVYVWPEFDDEIEIDIPEKDLRIDTFRSSGAGGQHVNVTDSAVRLTHLPTGIVISCQNERSQHKNKDVAMKVLKARLYDLKLKEQQDKLSQIGGAKKDIAFGSQIRSYVLQPYQMIKDHRTKYSGRSGRQGPERRHRSVHQGLLDEERRRGRSGRPRRMPRTNRSRISNPSRQSVYCLIGWVPEMNASLTTDADVARGRLAGVCDRPA